MSGRQNYSGFGFLSSPFSRNDNKNNWYGFKFDRPPPNTVEFVNEEIPDSEIVNQPSSDGVGDSNDTVNVESSMTDGVEGTNSHNQDVFDIRRSSNSQPLSNSPNVQLCRSGRGFFLQTPNRVIAGPSRPATVSGGSPNTTNRMDLYGVTTEVAQAQFGGGNVYPSNNNLTPMAAYCYQRFSSSFKQSMEMNNNEFSTYDETDMSYPSAGTLSPSNPLGDPSLVSFSMDSSGNSIDRKLAMKIIDHQRLFGYEGNSNFGLEKMAKFFLNSPGQNSLSPLGDSFVPIQNYLELNYAPPLRSRVAFTPRYRVLRACEQIAPIPIHLIFEKLDNIYKVNEGVFGEVYAGLFNGGRTKSVYKLVPIEGLVLVNDERQKCYEQIETEIRVSQRLNILSKKNGKNYTEGFCELYRSRLLHGSYPSVLTKAWKDWNRQYKSDNDIPRFGKNQLYVVFEYEHCGEGVETYKFNNAQEAYLILIQVAASLAVAEAELRFEHRDLHWGNILVAKTSENFIHFRANEIDYQIPSCGLKSSIIDYTMARCDDEYGGPIYDDLKDDEMQFSGQSDYQFEIYRMMRKENKNIWSEHYPKTNVFWLHYLADKLIEKANYREKLTSIHNTYIAYLQNFKSNILQFESCLDFIKTHCPLKPPSSS